MNVLFIHQNMPGQFRHLAQHFAQAPEHTVAFVTRRTDIDYPSILRASYDLRLPSEQREVLGGSFANQALFGEAAAYTCQALLRRGFRPDVIVGHPGWGELLFIKDVLPDIPLIAYCEFYNDSASPRPFGDPPKDPDLWERMNLHAQSAHLLLSLEAADRGWSPTAWQKSVHPAALRDKIEVIFDGVDTHAIRPDPGARFKTPSAVLGREDAVVTFTARSLEPTRGFPSFARAIAAILAGRPDAQIVIAGDPAAHYDTPPAGTQTWLEALSREAPLDHERVHLAGRLPYSDYVTLLQVSRVHVHLTLPTMLSWSLAEALSAGCLVVASEAPAVAEMITPEFNGLTTRFGDPVRITEDVLRALGHPRGAEIRANARRFAETQLSLDVCLPRQRAMLERAASEG